MGGANLSLSSKHAFTSFGRPLASSGHESYLASWGVIYTSAWVEQSIIAVITAFRIK